MKLENKLYANWISGLVNRTVREWQNNDYCALCALVRGSLHMYGCVYTCPSLNYCLEEEALRYGEGYFHE